MSSLFPPPSARRRRALALFLGGAAAAGIVYGTRAAISERLYFRARYGAGRGDVETGLALAARAARWCPYNYYLCAWIGKQAFYGRAASSRPEERLKDAAQWADAGYRLNPFNGEIVHLKTEVAAVSSPRAALAIWEPYAEWAFWNRFNQAFLADLYLRCGELEQAEETLYWLKDTPFRAGLERRLADAWRAERRARQGRGAP